MKKKDFLVKSAVSLSSLLIMSGSFAHQFNTIHSHPTAVPLSLTSSIVLGILLLAVGIFVLPRMEGRHIRSLTITTILAGLISAGIGGKLVSNAYASLFNCSIDSSLTPVGNCSSFLNAGNDVTLSNNSGAAIQITFSDNGNHQQQNSAATQGKNIEIVKLTKGPIVSSVIAQQQIQACGFPIVQLAIGDECYFDHGTHHGMNQY